MNDELDISEYRKLSQDINFMIKDQEILKVSIELVLMASKTLLAKLNGPMTEIPAAVKRLNEAIELCEECISKL